MTERDDSEAAHGEAIRAVGLGAGGHARVVIEALRSDSNVHVVGLLDPNPDLGGTLVAHAPVLGDDSLLEVLRQQNVAHFFVGVGDDHDGTLRRRLFARGLRLGFAPLSAVHERGFVSESARLGQGVAVMAGAVVNPGARVGDNVIVNTGAIVEHDCIVEDHVHVAPNATLCGGVRVERAALVGAGAVVQPGVRIGARATIGAGAVVLRDVPPGQVAAGVPARPLGERPLGDRPLGENG